MAIILSHPLPGCTYTDGFGWRPAIPSIGLPAQHHNGQDMAGVPAGTPILAAHTATVEWVGWDNSGGWGVRLDSPEGYSTLYFHMRERSPLVKVGDRVSAGQPIGHVGATGLATGPHLHFMLRVNGVDVDPVPYISGAPAPGETSQDMESEEMKRAMVYTEDGWDYVVIGEPLSGWQFEYSTQDAEFNNLMVETFQTGNFVYTDKSVVDSFRESLAAVRAGTP